MLVVRLRNKLFDWGLLHSKSYAFPVVLVGNLDVGGAGKTPMTEYIVALLSGKYKLATLSRGYGRNTKGYLQVHGPGATVNVGAVNLASQIGDEPAQFAQKFNYVTVAVCEKRATGIEKLMPNHQVVVLDDAYQHRAVKPGLSLLLMEYGRLSQCRIMLPAGNLREPYTGRKRATAIVITKCPPGLTAGQCHAIIKRVKPLPHQQVFFTAINYLPYVTLQGHAVHQQPDEHTTVFLLTGIANPAPLLNSLQGQVAQVIHHNYPDHHPYTLKNIAKLVAAYQACTAQKKLIITTEKDAQRLRLSHLQLLLAQVPVLVRPIGLQFLQGGGATFNTLLTDYVRQYLAHDQLH